MKEIIEGLQMFVSLFLGLIGLILFINKHKQDCKNWLDKERNTFITFKTNTYQIGSVIDKSGKILYKSIVLFLIISGLFIFKIEQNPFKATFVLLLFIYGAYIINRCIKIMFHEQKFVS